MLHYNDLQTQDGLLLFCLRSEYSMQHACLFRSVLSVWSPLVIPMNGIRDVFIVYIAHSNLESALCNYVT